MLRKLAVPSIGAAYVSPPAQAVRGWFDRSASPAPPVAAAVAAHVFYPELLPEVLACHAQLPDGSGLVITAPPERIAAVEAALGRTRGVTVVPVPNRGRDVAPFLHVLRLGLLDPFDAVLKIHTKRSPHLRTGDLRRRLLFAHLAGSRRGVARTLGLFCEPSTGMAGWRSSWMSHPLYWLENRPRVDAVCGMAGWSLPDRPTFFAGTMFWVRPKALETLRRLPIGTNDFEPEAGQVDATLHHAIERVFALAVAHAGYAVRDLCGRELPVETPPPD